MAAPNARPEVRWRDSALPAVINGLINGTIAWFTFRDDGVVPLPVDLISSD